MGIIRSLFAGFALIAAAIAQTSAPVAFTSVPAVVVAGSSYNITWGGGDSTPVTLTLRKGDPNDLDTIGILADGIDGTSYNWKVSDSLESGSDYALQITQGQADINYSGMFTITSSDNSTASATSSSHATITTTGSIIPTGAAGNSTGIGGSNATTTSSYTGRTITTTPAASAHTPTSATASTTGRATAAPDSNAAVQYGSSAAFVMGIVGMVMFLH